MSDCLELEELARLAGAEDDPHDEARWEHIDKCDDCRILIVEYVDRPTAVTRTQPERRFARGTQRQIELFAGKRIDRYEVIRKLGAGGMGVVLLADDPELQRRVVIKLLRSDLVTPGAPTMSSVRLLREAQAMARVSHPNVVPVYDVGVHDDQVFLAMEFIDGVDLAAWLQTPRPWKEVLATYVAAGRGLAAAHRAGLVHRDFKPHNVMVGRDGTVKVTDLGLARAPLTSSQLTPSLVRTLVDQALTRTGALVGTPAYMAPEQVRGTCDARSDQFSFCVALYEGLFGVRPFPGGTLAAILDSGDDATLTLTDAERPTVPRHVRRAIRRGLSVDPARRFASMEALLEAIAPRNRRKVGIGLVASVAAVIGSLALAPAEQHAPCSASAAQLAGVWDETRREAIEQAFLATGSPMAPTSFASVASALDVYARTWTAAHRDTCEATRVRGDQTEAVMDLRMSCLRRRRAELDALVGILATPDVDLMARSAAMPAALTDPEVCALVEALGSIQPSTDRAHVEALEDEMARATALLAAKRFDDARGVLTSVRSATTYKPVVAEAELAFGELELEHGNTMDAEKRLHLAIEAADASGHDRVRAIALLRLAEAASIRGKHDDGACWIGHARGAIERAGNAAELSGRLELRVASVEQGRGADELAEAAYLRAVDRLAAAGSGGATALAVAHAELAEFLLTRRAFERAFASASAARAVWATVTGPRSPSVAWTLELMANIRVQQGRAAEGVLLAEEALAIGRSYFGADHGLLAGSYQALAFAYQRSGRAEEAIATMERAVALKQKVHGAEHPYYARQVAWLGYLYRQQSRFDDAYRELSRALDIYRAAYGDDHADVVVMLSNLGAVRQHQRRYDEALALFDRAKQTIAKLEQPGSQAMADMLTRLGALHVDRGASVDALPPLEEALAMRVAVHAAPFSLAWTKFHLARALWDTRRDRARAVRLAIEAEREAELAGDVKGQADARAWLAAREKT